MNEEANFCSQCGATVTLGAKFCSSCGCDLQNSSTQTPLDKTIKVEVTNATVEKGFKAVREGFGTIGKVFKRKEKREEVESKEDRKKRIKQAIYRYPVINLIFIAVFIAIIFGLISDNF